MSKVWRHKEENKAPFVLSLLFFFKFYYWVLLSPQLVGGLLQITIEISNLFSSFFSFSTTFGVSHSIPPEKQ